MTVDHVSPRTRGGVVGGASAVTGIAAHAAAMGALPATSTLLVVIAAAVAAGAVTAAAPRVPLLLPLIVGQAGIHLLLIVLSGHHHDLFAPAMAVTHGAGTLVALALVSALRSVAGAIAEIVAVVVALVVHRGMRYSRVAPRTVRVIDAPELHLVLGTVGRRGPPAFAQ